MVTWSEFSAAAPDLAATGRSAALSTVRAGIRLTLR